MESLEKAEANYDKVRVGISPPCLPAGLASVFVLPLHFKQLPKSSTTH